MVFFCNGCLCSKVSGMIRWMRRSGWWLFSSLLLWLEVKFLRTGLRMVMFRVALPCLLRRLCSCLLWLFFVLSGLRKSLLRRFHLEIILQRFMHMFLVVRAFSFVFFYLYSFSIWNFPDSFFFYFLIISDKRIWFLGTAQACLQFSTAVFWILWAPTIVVRSTFLAVTSINFVFQKSY